MICSAIFWASSGLCAPIFAAPHRYDALYLWLGVYGYAIQIYFDFSGYSDMAIGLGAMFGFRFPENFDYPYLQPNIARFWRAWHMSLTSWITDYVYVPLGGNRRGEVRAAWNRLVSMTLCGLWHGARWTFVVWGLYHGVFLVLERVGLAALIGALPKPLRHAYALLVVMVGWVIFRADTLGGVVAMLAAMAGAGATTAPVFAPAWFWNTEVLLAVGAGIVGSTPVLTALGQRLAVPAESAGVRVLRWQASMAAVVGLMALLAASLMLSASRSYNPFIYFRF